MLRGTWLSILLEFEVLVCVPAALTDAPPNKAASDSAKGARNARFFMITLWGSRIIRLVPRAPGYDDGWQSSPVSRFTRPFTARRGTYLVVADLLNELLTRMYSDEGPSLGPVADLWHLMAAEYRDWLIHPN